MNKQAYCHNCEQNEEYGVKTVNRTMEVKGHRVSYEHQMAFCHRCEHEVFEAHIADMNTHTAYKAYMQELGKTQVSHIAKLGDNVRVHLTDKGVWYLHARCEDAWRNDMRAVAVPSFSDYGIPEPDADGFIVCRLDQLIKVFGSLVGNDMLTDDEIVFV